jgi:site-specific DNA-methyltransferase (cytosine-N4-specific)
MMAIPEQIADESVNSVITSTPYCQLRDYGFQGQWGLESTYLEFSNNLWTIMDEIQRVLTNDGTVWINLVDTYVGSRGYSRKQSIHNHNYSNGTDI